MGGNGKQSWKESAIGKREGKGQLRICRHMATLSILSRSGLLVVLKDKCRHLTWKDAARLNNTNDKNQV